MSRADAFLDAIRAAPDDETPWMIFADWLEERGDPRGELLRLAHTLTRTVAHPNRTALEARLQRLTAEGVEAVGPYITNSISMKLALIPAGTFLMGSPDSEVNHPADEGPQHQVTISRAFHLGVYPVTQREYEAVMGKNPSRFGGNPDNPVDNVSWEDAKAFWEALSALPKEKAAGRSYRLPTEAEWEYACRAGTTTTFHFGASASSKQANFDGNRPYGGAAAGPYLHKTTKVGSYPANAWGLYDMHGNVREWCADWHAEDYCRNSPKKDPQDPQSGYARVLRGGFWDCSAGSCRAASRGGSAPGRGYYFDGLRVCFRLD